MANLLPKYRFTLYFDRNDTVKHTVTPNYGNDLNKEYELENNQKFYRVKLSGKISFLNRDFDLIMSQDFETEYNLLIEVSYDFGVTWVNEFLGEFYRTDCDIDQDHKILEVLPEPIDEYTDVLAGLEKEYDLIPLKPASNNLVMQKRPLIQIYIPGDTVVSCFLGGSYWEQDANVVTDINALVNTYHFALCNLLKEINVTVTGSPAGASGLYTGKMAFETGGGFNIMAGSLRKSGDTLYRIDVVQMGFQFPIGSSNLKVELIRNSDNAVLFRKEFSGSGSPNYDTMEFTLDPVSGSGLANAEMQTYRIYARYLLDVETIQGLNTYELPADDIVPYNRNYRRALGYAMDVAFISTSFSETPTEWGRASNMLYFQEPYSIWGQKFYPIARSTWRYASIWFGFYIFDSIIETQGRKRFVLKDAYPIYSVLETLLHQFAPGIDHKGTPEYSEFLYSAQNPISYQTFDVFVTPKSNVLYGNYKQPAQKALTTLGQFLKMLREVYKCFWHIENGKLRVEHVSWYRNGGSYLGTPVVGIDLTEMQSLRSKKNWDYDLNKFNYDKSDMAERFQFDWMDDVTLPFKGYPIEVMSKYVTKGKIEDVSVSYFNSDVDFMLLAPEEMSKDGFALLSAHQVNGLIAPDGPNDGTIAQDGITPKYEILPLLENMNVVLRFKTITGDNFAPFQIVYYNGNTLTGSSNLISVINEQTHERAVQIPANTTHIAFRAFTYEIMFQFFSIESDDLRELPIIQRSIDGVDYYLQNGYLAYVTLHPNYWLHEMPARKLNVNKTVVMAYSVEKRKKQDVEFPIIGNPDVMKLIKTGLGNGTIEKVSINLLSRSAKTTLKHDTEE